VYDEMPPCLWLIKIVDVALARSVWSSGSNERETVGTPGCDWNCSLICDLRHRRPKHSMLVVIVVMSKRRPVVSR